MRTPNVYCATCSVPLGTGKARSRYFCGAYCELVWPGSKGARNAMILALYHGGMRDTAWIGRLYALTRQAVEAIIKTK